jgi:hypothetical protein
VAREKAKDEQGIVKWMVASSAQSLVTGKEIVQAHVRPSLETHVAFAAVLPDVQYQLGSVMLSQNDEAFHLTRSSVVHTSLWKRPCMELGQEFPTCRQGAADPCDDMSFLHLCY